MRHPTRVLLALALSVAMVVTAAAVDTLWVASRGAKLKEAQRALSKTVVELPAGTPLTVLEDAGKWYRVATPSGEEGWIYRGKVATTAPSEETRGDGGLFGAVTSSSIEAGAADTSRSIRGLSPETEEYANSAGSPQEARDALDRVTALTIADEELEHFLEQGRIGEYAQ